MHYVTINTTYLKADVELRRSLVQSLPNLSQKMFVIHIERKM